MDGEEKKGVLQKFKIDQLIDNLIGYVDTKIQLTKLEIEEEIRNILSNIIQYMIVFTFLLGAVSFLSLSLGIYLGKILDSTILGFSIVGLFYLLLFLVLILDKKKAIGTSIVRKIFSSNDNDQIK